MYINELKVKFLKIRNGILLSIGIIGLVIFGLSLIATLLETNDYELLISFTIFTLICGLLICFSIMTRKTIGNVYFFSRYFEGDLDGKIKIYEISELTGIKEKKLKSSLKKLLRKRLMKNYTIDKVNNEIILSSKTYQCECKSCGAIIDKKEYFTGTCSYCGSSDLFAKIITNNRCYNIVNETEGNILIKGSKANKYLNKHTLLKSVVTMVLLFIDSVLCLSSIIILPFTLVDYSAAAFGFFLFLVIAFGILVYVRFSSFRYIEPAKYYSSIFTNINRPFINIKDLPEFHFNRQETSVARIIRKNTMIDTKENISGAIKKGYLVNCTIEVHEGQSKVVLAKKIVKDRCPHCGASIVGTIDEVYKCNYCGNKIFNVIEKK